MRALSPPRCLVVVPDRELAYQVSRIISSHGLDVEITSEAFAALRLLRVETFDLLIYDVSSDGVDHDLVLDTLRRDLPAVLQRTVLLTTKPFESIRVPPGVPVIGRNDLAPLMRDVD